MNGQRQSRWCPGCDGMTLTREDGSCPWCDTKAKDMGPLLIGLELQRATEATLLMHLVTEKKVDGCVL